MPINKAVILGPYLSTAQPPTKDMVAPNTFWTENIAEVAARVKPNSLPMDLKNTPKDVRAPNITMLIAEKAATTTQP